jgi:hypothetical protein
MLKHGYKILHECRLDFANDPTSPQSHFIIDIYAKRKDQTILIECGDCKQNKLNYLRKYFKVIHYPFLNHPHENDKLPIEISQRLADDLGKRLVIK